MSWSQILSGSALVATLVVLAFVLGWQQLRQLRRLQISALPDEEMTWERRKAWRRIVSAGLLLLLAGLLGFLLVAYEPAAQRLADEREGMTADEAPAFTPEQRAFLRIWGGTWIAILLVLMAVVFLAAVDLWATRQYARRQFRKLQDDRRSMIARQVIRMRQERNGDDQH
ncbi:MAG: hypothetical protein U0840_28285 [Gemmataceae bacterium]